MNKKIWMIGLLFVLALLPELASAAGAVGAVTPGGIMANEAKTNFNAATFFLVLLGVVCFVASVIFMLKKEFAVAAGAFVGGIFALGLTSCVEKMKAGGMQKLTENMIDGQLVTHILQAIV